MNHLDNIKKVLVVGLGYRTGVAVCNFFLERGITPFVSDSKDEYELKNILADVKGEVKLFSGSQTPEVLEEGFDLLVLSPGVPARIPLVSEAVKRGIPVISEIELASLNMRGKVIGITGTDGKSTTTSLTAHVLREIGIKTFMGGNIGIPFISFVSETDDESVSVIELSSFQLETIKSFRPDVSAILNFEPDHLDRYDSMDDYFSAKKRIAENQTNEDFFIFRKDKKITDKGIDDIKARKLSFSLDDEADVFYRDGSIFIKEESSVAEIIKTEFLQIMGLHNVENTMASILMVRSVLSKMNQKPDYNKIADACYSFPGLEHRMEMIGEIDKRIFINDSKATTVNAVEMAVKSLPAKAVIILGGRTKGDNYSRMNDFFKEKILGVIAIGESKEFFKENFSAYNAKTAENMYDAVEKAYEMTGNGEIILLSPACASFDMYSSFEERGKDFRTCFERLKEKEESN